MTSSATGLQRASAIVAVAIVCRRGVSRVRAARRKARVVVDAEKVALTTATAAGYRATNGQVIYCPAL